MSDSQPNENSPSQSERENQIYQGSQTQTEIVCEGASCSRQQASSTVQLRLQPPKDDHKVKWTPDTVDNEFMGKKKSKCCCVYEKPKLFGESSTEEEEDDDGDSCTPNCRGHKKKCYRHKNSPHDHNHDHDHDHNHHGGHDDPGGFPPDGAMAT